MNEPRLELVEGEGIFGDYEIRPFSRNRDMGDVVVILDVLGVDGDCQGVFGYLLKSYDVGV